MSRKGKLHGTSGLCSSNSLLNNCINQTALEQEKSTLQCRVFFSKQFKLLN